MRTVRLTRIYHLCAGHRLYHPGRDDEWNRRVFGKCSHPDGHGHNYRLEVTLEGTPDGETGRVYPVSTLDERVEEAVLQPLDHHNLNSVLDLEDGPAPTTEVLLVEIWKRLAAAIKAPVRLQRLKLSETAKNSFEYWE